MSAVAVVGAHERSIRRSGAQDTTPMLAIGSLRASSWEGELRRCGIAQQQSALGAGNLEADIGMRRGNDTVLMVERGCRRMTISTTCMAAPQQRQTKVGTALGLVSSMTGWGCGALSKARALTRLSRRVALASNP